MSLLHPGRNQKVRNSYFMHKSHCQGHTQVERVVIHVVGVQCMIAENEIYLLQFKCYSKRYGKLTTGRQANR